MPTTDHDRWIDHLRRLAAPRAARDVALGVGALEAPFRRALGLPPPAWDLPAPDGEASEIALWRARTEPEIDVDALLAVPTEGGLMPQGRFRAIEVWTDAELAALHALWWLARARARPDWMARLAAVRDWHIATTQPDNATNRPWALHVFVLAGTPEAVHYAETLLHNCQTLHGHPDPLSAWILMDAADAIERGGGTEALGP